MVDEKPNKYERSDSLPIPSYDEAIRSSSSQSFLGAEDTSNDAQRQELPLQNRAYETPAVESVRASLDLLSSSGGVSSRASTEELRQEVMTQMDVLEPGVEAATERPLLGGNRLSNHITSFKHSLSSINLPFRLSRDYIFANIPSLIRIFEPNWIMAGRIFALMLVLFLVYLLFLSDIFTKRHGPSRMDYPDLLRQFVAENINSTNIRKQSQYLTLFDHVAGTKGSYVLAEFVQDLFLESQLEDVALERFDVYLNYPKIGGRKVAIVDPELAWEATIEEESAYWDREQTFVWHGHSRSGTVKGPLIYANYGSREDFQRLGTQGINMNGSIGRSSPAHYFFFRRRRSPENGFGVLVTLDSCFAI